MSDAVQRAFVDALLDSPGVTRQAVARRVGVHPSMVTRWLRGERNLRLGDAVYLVERFGPRALVEAFRVVGLRVVVEGEEPEGLDGDTGEVQAQVLAGLTRHSAELAERMARGEPADPAGLIQRVRELELLCQQAQRRLLSAG